VLAQLRDQLVQALSPRDRRRWKEPPVFFFDRQRQAALEAARLNAPGDPFTDLAAAIDGLLPALFASVEVRRVARAIDGLHSAAGLLAPVCSAALELAELLAIPEDEVFLVLHPARRAGFRLVARGIADVGQFHVLLAATITGDAAEGFLPGFPVASRFVAAYRDVNPASPAGVPMVVEARFQLLSAAALPPDGALPDGFAGCEHWLWPAMPLSAVPRVNGERVVLLGPPAFAATWDVSRRFPALAAELRLVETLSPVRVAEHLAGLTGRILPSQPAAAVSKAA
jgi:hypothetical protein